MDDENGTVPSTDGEHGNEVEQLQEALAAREAELLARTETEQELLNRLRNAMIASDPEVDPELVRGGSLAELEESFAKAKAVAERLRGIILPQGATRVPAGAPGRIRITPRSPFEKIRDGLSSH